jgi:hypothetical protein
MMMRRYYPTDLVCRLSHLFRISRNSAWLAPILPVDAVYMYHDFLGARRKYIRT